MPGQSTETEFSEVYKTDDTDVIYTKNYSLYTKL